MKAWHIVHWHESHESAESRKLAQPWWVPKPNKHDGMAYAELTKQKNALELYGAWTAVLEVASKGPRETRGWLIRNGRPLTATHLADLTRFPKEGFERALKFCSQPEIGWLVQEEFALTDGLPGLYPSTPGEPPGLPGHPPSTAGASAGASAGARAGQSPAIPPVQEDRKTGRQEGRQRSEEEEAASRSGRRPPSLKEMFAALKDQVQQMERRKEELTLEERAELRKKKRRLELVQDAQARGLTELPGDGTAENAKGAERKRDE